MNHFDLAWQIVRYQNQKTVKLTTNQEIRHKKHRLKDMTDCIKVEQDDIMKFGRVRFRVKRLQVNPSSNTRSDSDSSEYNESEEYGNN